jgi:hypothetical protein
LSPVISPSLAGNRLLSKANRRRLDFESMRDTLLLVAGNLDPSLEGRPVDLLKPREGGYANRRTVYGTIDRNNLPALFRTFDFANPDLSTAQRDATAVPQQALFFLNSPFVMEQASKLVNRLFIQLLDNDTERVRDIYQRVYQRDPSAEELRRSLRVLQSPSASTGIEKPSRTDSRRSWTLRIPASQNIEEPGVIAIKSSVKEWLVSSTREWLALLFKFFRDSRFIEQLNDRRRAKRNWHLP